ncbi:MAG: DUF6776 family protein [Pseudomonadales bacterium]
MVRRIRKVVVVPSRFWNQPLGIATIALLAFIAGGVVSQWVVRERQNSLEVREQALEAELASLDKEREVLQSRVADAEMREQVSAGAMTTLQSDLNARQLELDALREEVSHFRALLAPSAAQKGLQVASLKILATEKASTYRYELLLSQGAASRRIASGSLEMDLRFEQDGREESLSFSKVQKIDYYPMRYNFRYFQDFAGVIALPDGAHPLEVIVVATPAGKVSTRITRSFPWTVEDI